MVRRLAWTAFALGLAACAAEPKAPTPSDSPASEPAAGQESGEAPSPPPSAKAAEPEAPSEPTWEARPEDRVQPEAPFTNPERLASFYDALAELDDGAQRKVRVLHWGDSSIGLDQIPHAVRKRLQVRFGDGGPGFLLLNRYSKNYRPIAVNMRPDEAWVHCYIAYKCRPSGRYGLAGITFTSKGTASTAFRTLKEGSDTGTTLASAELWYGTRKGGGRVRVRVDSGAPTLVDTRAEVEEDRWERIEFEPGPHTVRVEATGNGPVDLHGVVLETDQPGVVWDSMTMIGAYTKRLMAWDPAHFDAQIDHREPDLFVFSYGGNDLRRFVTGQLDVDTYVAEYREVVDVVRATSPGTACLITGVHDHERSGTYDVRNEHMEKAVEAQRRTAEESGCAFFDIYAAMGGADSFQKWLNKSPRLAEPDRKHLNHRGRDIVGRQIFEAMLAGYVAHRTGAAPVAKPEG